MPLLCFDTRVQLWSSGKVAMVLSGIWEGSYLGDATPTDKTLKVASSPIGPSGQRGGFMGCNVFPMMQSSIVIFFALQRYFIKGVVMTGIKG